MVKDMETLNPLGALGPYFIYFWGPCLEHGGFTRPYFSIGKPVWPLHPVIVAIRDKKDYMRVLVYSCYTLVAGRPKRNHFLDLPTTY